VRGRGKRDSREGDASLGQELGEAETKTTTEQAGIGERPRPTDAREKKEKEKLRRGFPTDVNRIPKQPRRGPDANEC